MSKFSLQTEHYLLYSSTQLLFLKKNVVLYIYNTWYPVNNMHLDILKYVLVTNNYMLLHAAYQCCCL